MSHVTETNCRAAEQIWNRYMIPVQPPCPHSTVLYVLISSCSGHLYIFTYDELEWALILTEAEWTPVLFGNHITMVSSFPSPERCWNQHFFFFTPLPCPQITWVWQKHVITTALVRPNSGGSEGSAAISDIWGCSLWVWQSTECVTSHVNKCQLDSEWNSLDRMQQPCSSAGRVNTVSTVSDWGKEEMEPSLWAAARIILEVECTQNQFQHAFTLQPQLPDCFHARK